MNHRCEAEEKKINVIREKKKFVRKVYFPFFEWRSSSVIRHQFNFLRKNFLHLSTIYIYLRTFSINAAS